MAMFFALAVMLSGNVAEAGAYIQWEFTSVTVEPGRCIVSGYFYNDGDDEARVKEFYLVGNIAGIRVRTTIPMNTGYISPGDIKHWTFRISDDDFTNYDNEPYWNLHAEVAFRN